MHDAARDPSLLARDAIRWTWAWLAATLAVAATSAFQFVVASGLDRDTPMSLLESPPGMETVDMVGGLVSVPYLVAAIGGGFLVLKWIYRTNRNAHCRSDAMTVSPRWGVGWFFVPFALFWKPYDGVRETWQVSHDQPVLAGETLPVLQRWWTWWVVVTLLGNISLQLEFRGGTVGTVMIADVVDIIAALASIPLAFSLVALIRALTHAQVHQANAELFA